MRVVPPFRLDYTVAALQRVPTNPVEVWAEGGRYLRAFRTPRGPVVWELRQPEGAGSLHLRLHGPAADPGPWRALARRILGTDVDLAPFYAVAARVPVLADLAERYRGLKPPRFATLWESLVNTISFQQLSLASGMAAVGRLARRCASPVELGGVALYPFPAPDDVARLPERDLRGCGFSGAKVRSLRAGARAILDGALREDDLEGLPDAEVTERLREIPGIGPWTASLVLLRGLRRLSAFPVGDAGADRRLREVFGPVDLARLLSRLGPWRGMLYFHLLLESRFGEPARARRTAPRRAREGGRERVEAGSSPEGRHA